MTMFRCGHPYVRENWSGTKRPRCLTCARRYDEKRKVERSRGETRKKQDTNQGRYHHRLDKLGEPVMGRDPSVEALPRASHALLVAIYREHPGVFYQALQDGRYCVIPGAVM